MGRRDNAHQQFSYETITTVLQIYLLVTLIMRK